MATEEYDDHARERWVLEPRKRTSRTEFERDRARVLHSSSLRRLGAKTQVLGPGTDDFVRTRLTHSLEVAQIGRELGKSLGADPDVVETACLAHDLGHPPFGHNGERALDEVATTYGGFEGNAQTLRLLTRLEAKSIAPGGRSAGLNLTRASLDAATKYPWPRSEAQNRPGYHAQGLLAPDPKFGVYDDDRAAFDWLRRGAPDRRRCLEAQVMDWADDVAYSVHDVEDGVQSGAIDLARLRDPADRAELLAVVRRTYAPDAAPDELGAALDRVLSLDFVPQGHDGSRGALAALKNMTSRLIGRFAGAAETATRGAYGDGRLVRYAADLVVPPEAVLEVALLKGMAAHWVMLTDARVVLLERQRTLLAELITALRDAGPRALERPFAVDWDLAADDRGRERVLVDQVASLTDHSAVAWHSELHR